MLPQPLSQKRRRLITLALFGLGPLAMPSIAPLRPCWAGPPAAAEQPLKIERFAETTAPERPRLVLSVAGDVPIGDLSLTLLPGPPDGPGGQAGPRKGGKAPRAGKGAAGPESDEQKVHVPALRPGSPVTVPLGKGRVGRTLWHGQIRFQHGGRQHSLFTRFETIVRERGASPQSGRVVYDYSHLDLAARYVEVQLVGGGATRGEITAVGEDGEEIGAGSATFAGPQLRPGAWLRLAWTPRPGREAVRVLRLAVTLTDSAGLPVRVTLIPWSVSVPHEEVTFATGRWDIATPERGKLDSSYDKILAILAQVRDKGVAPRLYVTGHTDTVGSDGDNLVLSQHRARAIAGYLQQRGLAIPVLFAGAGERAPRVRTPDNTDEPQNRRADYVLSAGPPPLPAGVRWVALEGSAGRPESP